jgi:NAD(P)H-dependent flavin oxidoreductase YrpB (nitropropane dioxygenase family)
LCRKPEEAAELAEITDPELAAAVARYGELNAIIRPAEKEKESLAAMIRGLRGTANGWRVSTGQPGEDKEVPDMAAIEAEYAETGRGVPMAWKPGNAPRLTVTRVKDAKAVKAA